MNLLDIDNLVEQCGLEKFCIQIDQNFWMHCEETLLNFSSEFELSLFNVSIYGQSTCFLNVKESNKLLYVGLFFKFGRLDHDFIKFLGFFYSQTKKIFFKANDPLILSNQEFLCSILNSIKPYFQILVIKIDDAIFTYKFI